MTISEAKRRIEQLPKNGGSQTEAVSLLYCARESIYSHSFYGMSIEDFEDLFQDAVLYTVQNYSETESNGKSYFNYFMDILRYKQLDRQKKHRNEVSLDAPLQADTETTAADFIADPKHAADRLTEQLAAEEQVLMIFHLTEQMTALMNGNRLEKWNAYFRMFLTSRSVGAMRGGFPGDSELYRHERDILSSMDGRLLGYTYRAQPETLQAISCGTLKRYGELLPKHSKAEQPLDTPFINKVLCQYLQDCHGKQISEPALSKQAAQFSDCILSLCAV